LVRGYIRSKKNYELNRNRRNKFFPSSEQEILTVSSVKVEDKQPRILRLPSIAK
jgi:hypothetical protein